MDGDRVVSRQQGILWARIVIGVVLCFVLVCLVDFSAFVELLPRLRGDWLLLAVAIYSLAIILNVAAVQHVLRSLAHPIALSALTAIHLQGVFFNYFLPTNFGGDIYKVVTIGSRIGSSSAAVVAVAVQRSISLFVALCMLAGGVAAFSPASVQLAGGTVTICLTIAVALVLAASIRIPKSLKRSAREHRWVRRVIERWGALFAAAHEVRRPSVVVVIVLSLFVAQMLTVLGASAMSQCLGMDVGWRHFVYILPLSYLAAAAPVSINGLGVREGAVVILLTQLGVDRTTAAAFALAVLAINVFFALVGGVLFTLQRRREHSESA